MKIAIVGAGISGLAAARALDRDHEITLFEKDDRLGGHAHTVDVTHYGPTIPVDVGFIIFNRSTYPNLTRLLRELGARSTPTPMAFSVSLDDGRFEWATGGLNRMLAQRSNLLNPGFYRLLAEIVRFTRRANADLTAGAVGQESLRDYLARRRFGPAIVDRYLVPMGASIWSASADDVLDTPADVLLGFLKNHGLLSLRRPIWLTVAGGSRTYVERLRDELRATVRLRTGIGRIVRTAAGVTVVDDKGGEALFDHAILACHAPDALALLDAPTPEEREALGALKYGRNVTVLHGDAAFMPKRRRAWASWNYQGSSRTDDDRAPVSVTYWMNRLQDIDTRYPLFVTLNPATPPRSDLVFASFDFEHPQFDRGAVDAQQRLAAIQGKGNVWYCGAYAGYGFHEDGMRSGLEIAQALGAGRVELLGHPRIFR